jgi:hypothetical protein
MRLGEKEPAAVNGNVGSSSTSLKELTNIPEVLLNETLPLSDL